MSLRLHLHYGICAGIAPSVDAMYANRWSSAATVTPLPRAMLAKLTAALFCWQNCIHTEGFVDTVMVAFALQILVPLVF